jgi:hypothetical protein
LFAGKNGGFSVRIGATVIGKKFIDVFLNRMTIAAAQWHGPGIDAFIGQLLSTFYFLAFGR